MKRRRLISQGSLARLLQEAAEAWKRQDYPASLELLERAHRLDPVASVFDARRAAVVLREQP